MTLQRTCQATKRDGSPCRSQVLSDASFCFTHSPTRADERAEARRRGGQGRSSAARLRRLVPPRLVSVYDALEAALTDVRSGEITPQQGQAMAAIARALAAVLQAGELEQRLRDLEAGGGRQ
jgi:hypothetical protein